ncbi:MAG: MATE family efflux transporter [Acholeplasmataceae bacterium]
MTKDERKQHLILKDPNIIKGLFFLAVPLMLNNLIRTLHDVVDMYFVSEIPGFSADAVSSISLTFPVVFTFISFGMGLSAAGTALISQQVGSKQLEKARLYASNLVVIALITGVILNLFSFLSAPTIMRLMGTEGFVYENSVSYLRIRSFELPVLFLFFAFTSIRQASGDTVTPVIFGVITMVVNIILSPVFISVLGFGVPGAAYATLVGNVVIMPFGLSLLFRSKTGITIRQSYLKLDPEVSRRTIRTAIPASLGQSITAIGFGIMNSVIVSYGIQTVAAFSVGNRLISVILHPVMAIGAVLTAYIGQNIGNQNTERAKETFKQAMILSVSLMVFGSAILMGFREYLAAFFIKDDPIALKLTVEYMFYLLIGLPLMAVFQTFIGTFNGTGNTQYTFIISITRLWLLRLPLILFFRYFTDLGNSGIWYAMLISNLVIAFVGILLYVRIDFKPKIEIERGEKRSVSRA